MKTTLSTYSLGALIAAACFVTPSAAFANFTCYYNAAVANNSAGIPALHTYAKFGGQGYSAGQCLTYMDPGPQRSLEIVDQVMATSPELPKWICLRMFRPIGAPMQWFIHDFAPCGAAPPYTTPAPKPSLEQRDEAYEEEDPGKNPKVIQSSGG